ncbi:hypothetical protein [Herbiconiux daphne]|uniref:GNAT family N-acetyltransferase n=1 Tax=Herbiconiux daphne TaxID=2970914 RepID=A0ABT2H325_9MICO|nr:hypothetical protein [Herbiconiux daphne]MCS5734325.1 hypothetical protein [Herbiconiux daphne]
MFASARRADDQALLQFFTDEPVSFVDSTRFGRGLASGTYRRDWTWLGFVDDQPVARGVWWGPAGSVHPIELRCLVVHPSVPHPEVWGAAVIRSAHRAFAAAGAILAPDFVVDLDGRRRGEPAVEAALAWRRLAASAAGLPVETDLDDGRVSFSAGPVRTVRAVPLAGTRM